MWAMRRISPYSVCIWIAATSFLTSAVRAVPREWTDATGRKLTAELISAAGDQVTLSIQGKEYTMPITKLSEADQSYLREISKKPGQAINDPTAPPSKSSCVENHSGKAGEGRDQHQSLPGLERLLLGSFRQVVEKVLHLIERDRGCGRGRYAYHPRNCGDVGENTEYRHHDRLCATGI